MLEQMIEIVRSAGEIVRRAHDNAMNISEKAGARNIVTAYDVKVQEFLFEKLAALVPDAVFVGEENAENDFGDSGWRFIVDPIDGTANFAQGVKHCGVSVALLQGQCVEYAVVYDPYLDEMFSARRGGGAFLNGRPVHASRNRLEHSLVCFGTCPYDVERADETFGIAKEVFLNCLDLRRTGSASLDVCYAACGKFDLFFEPILYPWDYAAASLIVTEAGGVASDFAGAPLSFSRRCPVVAGSAAAAEDFRAIVARVNADKSR